MTELIPGRAEFFDESPVLTPEAARRRFMAWGVGKHVMSRMVAVGRLIPTEQELHILRELKSREESHSTIQLLDAYFENPVMQALLRDFLYVVNHDKARVGVTAAGENLMTANDPFKIGWHPDHANFVRWNASIGPGTIGATGWIDQKSTTQPEIVALLADGTLVEQKFAIGTVTRFLVGDIHCGPDDINRFFLSNTVRDVDYVAA